MSDEWKRSVVVTIYKNKGDIQSCTNYCGIKHMLVELWLSNGGLGQKIKLSINQFGFMPRRSIMELSTHLGN